MKKSSTKTSRNPSKASLREIPEVDLKRYRVIGRGRHVERAQRSLEFLMLDRDVVKKLGGPDAVANILRALAEALGSSKKRAA